jgi:hypothetical protein
MRKKTHVNKHNTTLDTFTVQGGGGGGGGGAVINTHRRRNFLGAP